MTSITPNRYCLLPPGVIQAKNGQEFRTILRKVRVAADVDGGLLAIRSGIPRSSIYSLGDPTRKGLPRSRDQVARYLECCRVHPEQSELILRLWDELSKERK
ncbi:hypothetical protein [Actinophytocola sp. KF-1]